ncbi:MAG: TolC family protein [Cyanobacteria bacterium J06635_10]
MKAQQILNSLLPGVTVAVLTTQPTWAGTLIVDNSHSSLYNSVFATSMSIEDALNDTFSLAQATVDNKPAMQFAPAGFDLGNLEPAKSSTSGVMVTGKTGVLIKPLNPNHQNTKTVGSRSHRKNDSSPTAAAIKKNPDEKIFQKLQQIAGQSAAAELLGENSCLIPEDSKKRGQNNSKPETLLSASASSSCREINFISNNNLTQPVSLPTVAPTRLSQRGAASTPSSLDPSANPLQYPTKPEEVRVDQTQSITLEQALELARRNNQELQVSLLQLEVAKAAVKQQQAALLPSLDLSTQITRQQTAGGQLGNELATNAGQIANPDNDAPTTLFNGGLQLNYSLFTSGARLAAIRQAEEQLRSQELDVERLSEEIRLNVATEYYNLQQADEQVRISRSAVENAEVSLRDAQALEEAGVRPKFDTLQAQVNLANAQQELTNARSSQRIARRQLVTRLNLAQSATVTAADPVKLAGLWRTTLENSIVLAYQNRPELQQQLAVRNINEQQRRQALSALGPQVSVVANYNLLDDFNDSVGVTDGYSIALTANLNLFDGGASRAQAAQAKANIEVAETQFSQQRNNIRLQVEQAYSSLQSNLENVQTSEAALGQANESVRLARLRFQAGVGTQLEVINAENALTRAEGNRINAILDYNRALASLQRAVTSRGFRNR